MCSSDLEIAVAFSASDNDRYVSSYAIAGFFDGTSVTWGSEQLLQAGLGNYLALDGVNRNRWGDYSSIQVDPLNPRSFWTIQEFASGTNQWQMKITELKFNAVPEPGSLTVLLGGMALGLTRLRPRRSRTS